MASRSKRSAGPRLPGEWEDGWWDWWDWWDWKPETGGVQVTFDDFCVSGCVGTLDQTHDLAKRL